MVAEILLQLCHAIHDIQEASVVHRDVKPDNIFVDDDGFIKIGDFGCAKQYMSDESGSPVDIPYAATEQLTDRIGAPDAQGPEVMRLIAKRSKRKQPKTLRAVFEKADIFAVARMVWQLCCSSATKKFPDHSAQSPPTVPCSKLGRKHRTACVAWPTWFDSRLCMILTSLLQWDPEDRMSASTAITQLELMLYGPPPLKQLREQSSTRRGARATDSVLLRQWLCRQRVEAVLGVRAGERSGATTANSASHFLKNKFLLKASDATLMEAIVAREDLEKWYFSGWSAKLIEEAIW